MSGARRRPHARRARALGLALAGLVLAAALVHADGAGREPTYPREAPFRVRPLRLEADGAWLGEAIAYGPHRDGQRPGGAAPSLAQVRDDLVLLRPHWRLVRVYNAVGTGETVLQAIREGRLGMRVMLGLWVAAEERRDSTGRAVEWFPAARAENRREIEAAVRLARAYPDLVVAVCVGNETQIEWSANRVPEERLVALVREVRARTRVPVTTSDDYNLWNKPRSRALASELDFVSTHLHPLWNGASNAGALDWVRTQLAAIRALHPDRTVIVGETGWATRRNDQGDQGRLMKGALGEAEQAAYLRTLGAWVRSARVPTFVFEAFDENWKGGPDPDDVEKHWGLYRADRTPKAAMAQPPVGGNR